MPQEFPSHGQWIKASKNRNGKTFSFPGQSGSLAPHSGQSSQIFRDAHRGNNRCHPTLRYRPLEQEHQTLRDTYQSGSEETVNAQV